MPDLPSVRDGEAGGITPPHVAWPVSLGRGEAGLMSGDPPDSSTTTDEFRPHAGGAMDDIFGTGENPAEDETTNVYEEADSL